METQPTLSAIIEISVDSENDTYKTKSYIEVSNDELDLPRDVLLSMVYELGMMSRKLMDNADIDQDELNEYLEQRKLISEEAEEEPPRKNKKKDAIDQTIDHLFEETDEDNSDS